MTTKQRVICWFSCGSASACAAKESIRRYSHKYEVLVVNCDTRSSEHSDNYRFSLDVEKWLGQPIVYIKSDKYKDVDDVVEKTHYMSGINGARCTTELKKIPRLNLANPDDYHVFGFTADEKPRVARFKLRNPDMLLLWPLIEAGITKAMCHKQIEQAGIIQPEMYRLGFDNNNCPGCLKATGVWYWDRIRTVFPSVFQKRCEQSRMLNVRLIKYKSKRIFLDELPPGPYKKPRKKENLSCGPECGFQPNLL